MAWVHGFVQVMHGPKCLLSGIYLLLLYTLKIQSILIIFSAYISPVRSGSPGEQWLKGAMVNSSNQLLEWNREKVSSAQHTDRWQEIMVDTTTYFCELTRYDMSRKFPSGGINDKTLSDSQRLNRMQGWKLTSSRSLGFCHGKEKTSIFIKYNEYGNSSQIHYEIWEICFLKIKQSCKFIQAYRFTMLSSVQIFYIHYYLNFNNSIPVIPMR